MKTGREEEKKRTRLQNCWQFYFERRRRKGKGKEGKKVSKTQDLVCLHPSLVLNIYTADGIDDQKEGSCGLRAAPFGNTVSILHLG